MLLTIKKLSKISKYIFILIILIFITIQPLEVYGKLFNQNKEKELSLFLDRNSQSLILLTVTGDQRYKNKDLEKIYKNLQIIHILVISAGNIFIFLSLIQIFIHRISMTNYIISLIVIYIYGRLISFPETFIRSLQTIAITGLFSVIGVNFSKIKVFVTLLIIFILSLKIWKLGLSYQLSVIFSLIIYLFNLISERININKVVSFLTMNAILTVTSAILFQFSSFSIICTSFVANIFITKTYDIAILIAYIIFILPTSFLPTSFTALIKNAYDLLFIGLKLLTQLTYNICHGQ